MAAASSHYRVCIIRVWQEHSTTEDIAVWRYTLEVPSSSQRRGFNSRRELLEALSQELLDGQASDHEIKQSDRSGAGEE